MTAAEILARAVRARLLVDEAARLLRRLDAAIPAGAFDIETRAGRAVANAAERVSRRDRELRRLETLAARTPIGRAFVDELADSLRARAS